MVRDYYAGVAWAVALLQRQWRAALARRVVWWRRANGGEQQHVLRAQEVATAPPPLSVWIEIYIF